jgi:hypothetical protein
LVLYRDEIVDQQRNQQQQKNYDASRGDDETQNASMLHYDQLEKEKKKRGETVSVVSGRQGAKERRFAEGKKRKLEKGQNKIKRTCLELDVLHCIVEDGESGPVVEQEAKGELLQKLEKQLNEHQLVARALLYHCRLVREAKKRDL